MQFHNFFNAVGLHTCMCENHHNCIFMNINEKNKKQKTKKKKKKKKNVYLITNIIKKNGCLPTKMLISEHSFVLKMTKSETTVMRGYRAVFLVVNNANID